MAGEEAEASPFELVASTVGDETSAADPWVQAITMPTGTSKLVVDVMCVMNVSADATSDTLDPGGADDALSIVIEHNGGAPGISSTNPAIASSIWRLYDADMSATGGVDASAAITASSVGFRHLFMYHGALQSVEGALYNASGYPSAQPASLTKSAGTFAAGSHVYGFTAWTPSQAMDGGYPTGDALTVVRADVPIGALRFWLYSGVLGGAQATVTFTSKPTFGTSYRIAGIFVVEPA